MDNRHEAASFAGQRVIDRIVEQPIVASYLLEDLREDPIHSQDKLNLIKDKYGGEAQALYSFLGSVIRDRDLYLEIDFDQSVIELASQDPRQQQLANELRQEGHKIAKRSQEELAKAKEKLTLSNRANELLALARLVTLSQLTTQEQQKERA